MVFEACAVQPQDIFLRLPHRRIYIAPHVQEFLAGLDSEWEERLTRWTLGVRNALEAGDALPLFPTVAAKTSRGAGPVLGGRPSVREQNDQGDTARETTKGRQNAGNRDSTSAGQVVTPRTAPIAPTATPAAAKSTPRCGGRGKPAARGRRGRPRGTGRGQELPAQDKETARAGGDAQGQGTAHRPRPRVAKVEGWRIPELPAHTAVRI